LSLRSSVADVTVDNTVSGEINLSFLRRDLPSLPTDDARSSTESSELREDTIEDQSLPILVSVQSNKRPPSRQSMPITKCRINLEFVAARVDGDGLGQWRGNYFILGKQEQTKTYI